MKITIAKGHEAPISRTTQNGIRWSQLGYAHMGGAFPQEIQIPLSSAAAAYPVGDYQLSERSFRVGKYGGLEVNPFDLILEPLSSAVAKAG